MNMSELELDKLAEQTAFHILQVLKTEQAEPILGSLTGDQVRALFDEALPKSGCDAIELLEHTVPNILKSCRRNGHPRFFGYVCASVDPIGIFADTIASALNQNVTAWRSAPGASEIERLVLRWLDEMVGFAGSGNGILVSGGSAANTTAITAAIVYAESQSNVSRDHMTVYVSTEGHMSLKKAALLLGIKSAHIRQLAINERREMSIRALVTQLEDDIAVGLIPACICASAGIANTGAIDPLNDIADLCTAHGVWFHIDGAYGAPAAMVDRFRWMQQAFARGDSLSIDPHKWLFAPIDVGCLLVRHPERARQAFSITAEYVQVTQDDPIEKHTFFEHGMELSRRFRALKVWMILKVRGVEKIAAVIDRNIDLRRQLDKRIYQEPRLEWLGSQLSISCFRYVPDGWTQVGAINKLNKQILNTIVQEGHAFMSPTKLDGRYSLRVCIVNFRTTRQDIDFLIDEVLRLGQEIAESR